MLRPPAPHLTTIALLLAAWPAMLTAQNQAEPLTIVDLINVPALSDPRLSPDGNQLLYVRSDPYWKQNKTVTHIWRFQAAGSSSVQLTNGKRGERSPRWSPDGASIVFIAQRDDDKHSQIYHIPNNGGEAIRLTQHPTAVSRIQWSPDGEWVYFVAKDAKTDEEKARDDINDNVFRFDETEKSTHIWRLEVATGATEQVSKGPFTIRGYEISRDGSRIAHQRAPGPLYDDSPRGEVWVMDADGNNAQQITNNPVGESQAALSPNNDKVLFVANSNDQLDEFYFNPRLFVASASGDTTPEAIVAGGDYSVGSATWSADGKSVYFTANTGVRQNIYCVNIDNKNIQPVTGGDHSIRSFHYVPGADAMLFTAPNPRDPGEIQYLSMANTNAPSKMTHVFDELVAGHRLPRVEAIQWLGEDNVEIEGLLYYPLNYEEGTRYPVVVQTHGGPASSDKFGFFRSSNYEPVLTSLGYFVFKPNYRGSTGYGDAFLRDMVGNYFNQAHKDVMAGVDALIERGMVDGDRMAKMGWSAGGHMTNKIITYTDRFKAASSGAGAINWVSMYGQSDVRIYRTPWFGGSPWDKDAPIEQYLADSPLFDIHKVTTPTLVLVGENDVRVPMAQSVELYRALKHNNVPTHLYVAPKQGHGWRELQQRLFKANVELDWFERWVNDRDYVWEKSPVHPEGDQAMEADATKTGR